MRSNLVALALASAAVLGCSRELTRSRAANLIGQHAPFATTDAITPQEDGCVLEGGLDSGELEGLWNGRLPSTRTLTQKGGAYFVNPERWPNGWAYWKLRTPAHREVIDVTGITDVPLIPGGKQAEFTWRYRGLDPVVARYTGQGPTPHTGAALMRLYDDGWRVERFELRESGRGPVQWLPEIKRQADDILQQRARAEERRRLAMASTTTLATLLVPLCGSSYGRSRRTFTITDADVTVTGNGGALWGDATFHYSDLLPPAPPRKHSLRPGCETLTLKGRRQSAEDYVGEPTVLREVWTKITAAHTAWRTKYPDLAAR